ncbi:MAG TPA: TraM recognition domain-containing protein, partial [Candidatus Fimimorpha faecalis]|nr:TraM recognition domain-containing protein [Candidatus Fimimorpha faecalis]
MIASFFYPYGANRNIKIFIGSDDPDTRREFSELCGQKKVKNFSVNTSAE